MILILIIIIMHAILGGARGPRYLPRRALYLVLTSHVHCCFLGSLHAEIS